MEVAQGPRLRYLRRFRIFQFRLVYRRAAQEARAVVGVPADHLEREARLFAAVLGEHEEEPRGVVEPGPVEPAHAQLLQVGGAEIVPLDGRAHLLDPIGEVARREAVVGEKAHQRLRYHREDPSSIGSMTVENQRLVLTLLPTGHPAPRQLDQASRLAPTPRSGRWERGVGASLARELALIGRGGGRVASSPAQNQGVPSFKLVSLLVSRVVRELVPGLMTSRTRRRTTLRTTTHHFRRLRRRRVLIAVAPLRLNQVGSRP